jgi:phage host-nuclease inhibitor protein Gam
MTVPEKYTTAAKRLLEEEVENLAKWLYLHSEAIRKEHGEDVTVFVSKTQNLTPGDLEWHYGSVGVELTYGKEVL